jgi:hypothetical protein
VTTAANPLPYAVRQALIQACGKVFYYKGGMVELFASAGVPSPAVQRYVRDGLVKYQIARRVLEDLDRQGAAGRRVQWQVVDALVCLDGAADDIANPSEARAALERLRKAASRGKPAGAGASEAFAIEARRRQRDLRRRVSERQAKEIEALRERFAAVTTIADRQERGYAFERFLGDLFQANDIEYRGAYRVGVEQIDGAFCHAGRDFLVEARWRIEPPSASDLLAFAHKVEGKLQATLGLVITMVPPRPEVLDHVAARTRSVILMDGTDLALVLEGQVTLPDALEHKRQRAAQEGIVFARLGRAHAA